MVVLERAVKFEEVDAAGLVFFGRYASYAHEAIERLFAPLEGGYAGLITERKLGVPVVRLETDYIRPLRFGDVVRIEATVERLGERSGVFGFRLMRHGDDAPCATVRLTFVVTDLEAMVSCDMPHDVRTLLLEHLAANGSA
jgi:4-hydroxybenzoyl-CoA thioesterase